MTMKEISFSNLLSNLASVNLSLSMKDIEFYGEEFFVEKMRHLQEAVDPEKKLPVAIFVMNAYQWGIQYANEQTNNTLSQSIKKEDEK